MATQRARFCRFVINPTDHPKGQSRTCVNINFDGVSSLTFQNQYEHVPSGNENIMVSHYKKKYYFLALSARMAKICTDVAKICIRQKYVTDVAMVCIRQKYVTDVAKICIKQKYVTFVEKICIRQTYVTDVAKIYIWQNMSQAQQRSV